MKKINAEQAEKIKDTQLSNALKRLKEGKSLTLGELRLIQEATGERKHGMASTIGQAAARLKIPVEIIKIAKRGGCDAFRGSRIDCDKLKEWLDTNDVKKLQAEANMKQLQLEIKRGQYLELDAVRSAVSRHVTTARSVMHGKGYGLAMILASMTGADPIMIEEKIRARDKEVIAELHVRGLSIESVKCECGKEIRL